MAYLDLLDKIEADADRKLDANGTNLSQLTEIEQIAVIRRAFQWEVNNGGLYTFLWNPSGEYAKVAVLVLKLLGALAAALLLEQANNLFGQDGPSLDVLVRRRQLAAFDDDQRARIEQLTDEYFALEYAGLSTANLLVAYVLASGSGSAS